MDRPSSLKSRQKKWQAVYRTATTAYPCYIPVLGEFSRSWSYRLAGSKIACRRAISQSLLPMETWFVSLWRYGISLPISRFHFVSIRLSFTGTGGTYAPIWFKNLILRMVTLNFYYPWAKAATLQYQYAHTEIDGTPLEFSGTGKQLLRGYIVALGILAVLGGIAWWFSGMLSEALLPEELQAEALNQLRLTYFVYSLLLLTFTVYPLAIHGTLRYRLANLRWRGIRMGYSGKLGELYWLYLKGALLTVVTFGIGRAWMTTWILRYLADHVRVGQVEGMFNGKGGELFVVQLKRNFAIGGVIWLFAILAGIFIAVLMPAHSSGGDVPTLVGIMVILGLGALGLVGWVIIPWAVRLSYRFIFQNSYLYLNDLLYPIESVHTIADLRMCYFVLPMVQALTMGFATPWVWPKKQAILLDGLRIDEEFPMDALLQVNPEYTSAVGEDLSDAMDLTGGFEMDLGL